MELNDLQVMIGLEHFSGSREGVERFSISGDGRLIEP